MGHIISVLFLSGAVGFSVNSGINSWLRRRVHTHRQNNELTLLRNDLRDEIEDAARQRAYEKRSRGDGVGETAAGAILAGLLVGPFGALVSERVDDLFYFEL